jgi:hypothetical protein
VKVVGNQSPYKTFCIGFRKHLPKAIEKINPVNAIVKYFSSLDASYDNMMKVTGSINTGVPWQTGSIIYQIK